MPIVVGVLACMGLVIGGVLSHLFGKMNRYNIYSLHAFCGSILAGLLLFDIIPETFHHQPFASVTIGVVGGVLIMILLEQLFPHHHDHDMQPSMYSFLFLIVAIFIHNIPSGFAWGSTLTDNSHSHITLLAAIFLHHIPEGVALMIPCLFIKRGMMFYISGIIVLSSLLSICTWLGGHIILESLRLQGIMMGLAIGGIGYVTVHEMLWKAKKRMNFLSFLLYLFIGISVIAVYSTVSGHH
ncbi:ZIP family metal transporter [Priestia taiwanensis]|uniref:Zinc uptake transporter n=1 Tax=Priestia taiwanensis TaxID=1347902 RepID=A0A917ANG1_9BACI|nr:ZIP family metal transporter [Priestia taiwanensis]MBM7362179.1 ZIP family zinc transporter [Priestia taiwanensis]GGE60003.1 zinc uptake transporter [Priestia taiwanensis]